MRSHPKLGLRRTLGILPAEELRNRCSGTPGVGLHPVLEEIDASRIEGITHVGIVFPLRNGVNWLTCGRPLEGSPSVPSFCLDIVGIASLQWTPKGAQT